MAARADSTTIFRVTSDWGSGFGGALEVVNGSQPLTDWRLEFDFPYSIDSIWNARILSHSGQHYMLAGEVTLYDSWAAVDKPFAGDVAGQPFMGNLNQLVKLKQANPKLLTMISVGGWTLSGRFSDVAFTATSRQYFAASAVSFITRYGFDGVDIDWEYPGGGGAWQAMPCALKTSKTLPCSCKNCVVNWTNEVSRMGDAITCPLLCPPGWTRLSIWSQSPSRSVWTG